MEANETEARPVLRLLVAGAPAEAASALRQAGLAVEARVVSGASALVTAVREGCDCVLAGLRCGDLDAPALIAAVREIDPLLPLIVIGAGLEVQTAVELVRAGAGDCLALDDLDLLAASVARECAAAARRQAAEPALDDALRVGEALSTMTETLVTWLHSPVLLEHACQTTAAVLSCDAAATLVIEGGFEVAAAAAFGGTAEEREAARVMRWPLELLQEPLRELEQVDCCEQRGTRLQLGDEGEDGAVALRLYMALRRGGRLIGIQVATRYGDARPFGDAERRIAAEISRLLSLALDDARAVEELRRAGRVKSEFVRTVSHDLRVPLTTVIGYADLLAEGAFGALSDEQRPILRRIGERARGLLELITATLDLPSLESGRVNVEVAAVDIGALFDELGAEAGDWRLRRDLELAWELQPGLAPIESDRAKLKVVLKNLVVNALKFTDRGAVRVTAVERDGGVEIAVADTGIGIAAERVERIFDAFWQEDGSATRRHGGVGLGLYIVRRLVEILGGEIAVESAPGTGSTFRVWLPRAAAPPPSV